MLSVFKRFALLGLMVGLIYGIETVVTHLFGDQTLAPLLSILCCAALVILGSPAMILPRSPSLPWRATC